MERYEINHDGKIVTHESARCSDLDKMLTSLFSQYGWTAKIVEKQGSCRRIFLKDANDQKNTLMYIVEPFAMSREVLMKRKYNWGQ